MSIINSIWNNVNTRVDNALYISSLQYKDYKDYKRDRTYYLLSVDRKDQFKKRAIL